MSESWFPDPIRRPEHDTPMGSDDRVIVLFKSLSDMDMKNAKARVAREDMLKREMEKMGVKQGGTGALSKPGAKPKAVDSKEHGLGMAVAAGMGAIAGAMAMSAAVKDKSQPDDNTLVPDGP